MSVVLNALQVKNENPKEPLVSSRNEGLFIGKNKINSSRTMVWVGLILTMFFLFMGFGIIYYAWFAVKPPALSELQVNQVKKNTAIVQPSPKELSQKAAAFFKEGNFKDSVRLYQQATQAGASDSLLLNDLGMAYLKNGQLLEGEKSLKQAIELAPSCAECHNNLGYIQSLLGQDEKAQKSLKRALLLQDCYADAYFNLGVLYQKNSDLGRAAQAYEDFLDCFPEKTSSFYEQVKQRVDTLGEL